MCLPPAAAGGSWPVLSGALEAGSAACDLGHPSPPPQMPSPFCPHSARQAAATWVEVSKGLLPGDLVRAGHGDELLTQQDTVPRLYRAGAPDGDGPFPRLDLRAQVPAELPDHVLAAGH